jgi:hypothetical protein
MMSNKNEALKMVEASHLRIVPKIDLVDKILEKCDRILEKIRERGKN